MQGTEPTTEPPCPTWAAITYIIIGIIIIINIIIIIQTPLPCLVSCIGLLFNSV